MAFYKLVISPLVRKDMEAIHCHGRKNWGLVRASHYLDELGDRLWGLTVNPKSGVGREDPYFNLLPALHEH